MGKLVLVMEHKYIGLDIGTTAIKISVVDVNLNPIYEKQYYYKYLSPQKDWTEINPDTWVEIVLKGFKELFQYLPVSEIKGIGITGQMHTTVFVDKHGCSVRPAIMWNDNRTKEQIPKIKAKLLKVKETAHIAKIVSTGSPLANLLWVKNEEPEQFEKIDKIMIAKDYVILKLTGNYSTDFCDASTSSLYDLNRNTWSIDVQNIFGFNASLFPVINVSSKVVGYLQTDIRKDLEINHKIPVVAGTGDNVASAIAAGSIENNQPLISLGTSGVLVIPNQCHQLKTVGKNVVAKVQKDDNTIITQGTVQAGAKTNSWWMETIIKTNDYLTEQKKIPDDLLGNNEVIFLPHLNGEKTLYGTPDLRGSFVGLSLETSRSEMYLAVLEGVAFGIRQLFDKMKNNELPEYFTIVGGGAKSELWSQLFADILNTPIKRVFTAQEAVHGAAILAILGVNGQYIPPANAGELIQPDKQRAKSYEKYYYRYVKLVKLMLNFTEEVAENK